MSGVKKNRIDFALPILKESTAVIYIISVDSYRMVVVVVVNYSSSGNAALTAASFASNSLRSATVRSGLRGSVATTWCASSQKGLLTIKSFSGRCSYLKYFKIGSGSIIVVVFAQA
jgi:hypothetical protein